MGKSGHSAEIKAVVAAVCAAYVVRERRDRLAAKPDELFDKLCHNPEVFDERRVVPVQRSVPDDRIARLLRGGGDDVAFYLGAWDGLEVGAYTVVQAVEMVERCGGGLAALPDAGRVYYKSEDNERFFLVADADDRKRLTTALAAMK
jgi:hypothetical protein